MKEKLLMIFVKNLIPGTVKTRLSASIGISKTLDIYRELIRQTYKIVHKVHADKQVHYSEYIASKDLWNNGGFLLSIQKGESLGEKMSYAFQNALVSYKKVVLIGSDCYDLSTKIIADSFELLNDNDIVVGPAYDGGFYLLGMKKYLPELFANKKYSTHTVLNELMKEAKNLKKTVAQLPKLSDIDTLEDLKKSKIDWTPI